MPKPKIDSTDPPQLTLGEPFHIHGSNLKGDIVDFIGAAIPASGLPYGVQPMGIRVFLRPPNWENLGNMSPANDPSLFPARAARELKVLEVHKDLIVVQAAELNKGETIAYSEFFQTGYAKEVTPGINEKCTLIVYAMAGSPTVGIVPSGVYGEASLEVVVNEPKGLDLGPGRPGGYHPFVHEVFCSSIRRPIDNPNGDRPGFDDAQLVAHPKYNAYIKKYEETIGTRIEEDWDIPSLEVIDRLLPTPYLMDNFIAQRIIDEIDEAIKANAMTIITTMWTPGGALPEGVNPSEAAESAKLSIILLQKIRFLLVGAILDSDAFTTILPNKVEKDYLMNFLSELPIMMPGTEGAGILELDAIAENKKAFKKAFTDPTKKYKATAVQSILFRKWAQVYEELVSMNADGVKIPAPPEGWDGQYKSLTFFTIRGFLDKIQNHLRNILIEADDAKYFDDIHKEKIYFPMYIHLMFNASLHLGTPEETPPPEPPPKEDSYDGTHPIKNVPEKHGIKPGMLDPPGFLIEDPEFFINGLKQTQLSRAFMQMILDPGLENGGVAPPPEKRLIYLSKTNEAVEANCWYVSDWFWQIGAAVLMNKEKWTGFSNFYYIPFWDMWPDIQWGTIEIMSELTGEESGYTLLPGAGEQYIGSHLKQTQDPNHFAGFGSQAARTQYLLIYNYWNKNYPNAIALNGKYLPDASWTDLYDILEEVNPGYLATENEPELANIESYFVAPFLYVQDLFEFYRDKVVRLREFQRAGYPHVSYKLADVKSADSFFDETGTMGGFESDYMIDYGAPGSAGTSPAFLHILEFLWQQLSVQKMHSETIFYKIEKFDISGTLIQTYWLPNTVWEQQTYQRQPFINFTDTAVRYNVPYKYKIWAYEFIVGAKWGTYKGLGYTYEDGKIKNDTAPRVDVVQNPKWYIHGVQSTDAFHVIDNPPNTSDTGHLPVGSKPVILTELLYAETDFIVVVDHPPLAPQAEILSYKGINNKALINLDGNVGEILQTPIIIEPSDIDIFNAIKLAAEVGTGRNDGRVRFKNDDPAPLFEIYRYPLPSEDDIIPDDRRRPASYLDFSGHLLDRIAQPITTYVDESIKPNRKYYYIFRTRDVHNSPSNPTAVYEFEIVSDANSTYSTVNVFSVPAEPTVSPDISPVKSGRKYIRITPSLSQELALDSDQYGSEAVEHSVFGKSFKIRLTSKKSGKKLDINVDFEHKEKIETLTDKKGDYYENEDGVNF